MINGNTQRKMLRAREVKKDWRKKEAKFLEDHSFWLMSKGRIIMQRIESHLSSQWATSSLFFSHSLSLSLHIFVSSRESACLAGHHPHANFSTRVGCGNHVKIYAVGQWGEEKNKIFLLLKRLESMGKFLEEILICLKVEQKLAKILLCPNLFKVFCSSYVAGWNACIGFFYHLSPCKH